jgi:hypothetical protein
MKIAICFHDNDFHCAFTAALNFLKDADIQTGIGNITKDKDKLCLLINQLLPICYLTHQNHWRYNGLEKETAKSTLTSKEYLNIKNYLHITADRILLDGEVDEYLEETNWDNGETFILDTDIKDEACQVYSI